MGDLATSDGGVQAGRERRLALLAGAGILAVALAARVLGINYGLPYLFYHHDEPQIVLRALRFGTGDFNPHLFWWPGTFQMDLMFGVYAVMFVVERLAGHVASSVDFAASYFRDPSAFYLSGRIVTLGFGLATVWLVARLGRRLETRAVGSVAAFFLATNAMHAEWSRLALPLVPMVFWVILAFLACLKVLEARRARWYLLAGAFAGLAASCLYYGGAVALMIPVAHWLGRRGEGARAVTIGLDWRLYAALGAMVTAFIVVCPYAVLDWRGFRQDITATYFGYARWETASVSGAAEYVARCVTSLGRSLRRAVGLPIGIAAVVGLGLGLRRPTPKAILTAVFILVYLAIVGFSTWHRGRHMAPVLPMLTVLAAAAALQASRLFRPNHRQAALLGLTIMLALPSGLEVARVGSELLREDTRIEAKRWVESTIPAGTKIVLDASSFRNTASAPLEETDLNIEGRINDLKSGSARGYGYTGAYLKYYEMMLQHRRPSERQYDQWWTEFGANVRPVEWFRENGYRYAIVSSIVTERYYDEGFSERFVKSTPFYRDLDSLAVLVKTFEPRPWTKPGPTLKVYQIQ